MLNRESQLQELLLTEQKLGFYTEFFVESGYLDEQDPRFRFGNPSLAFDLASLTKALVTAPLMHHHFANELHLPLNEGIFRGEKSPFSSAIMKLSPFELLVHRSGLPAWRNLWLGHLNEGELPSGSDRSARIEKAFERIMPAKEKTDLYSDLGYILCGYILEKKLQVGLDELWSNYLKGLSLSAGSLGFARQISIDPTDFVPSAFCAVRNRLLQGEVHDENSASLGGVTGHAGLFGRGPELALYLKQLIRSKEGLNFLQANEKERNSHHFEGLYGLRRGAGESAAPFAEGQAMGHLGFVGTAFWLHLPTLRYGIFLSNRVISGRVNAHITAVRRAVFGGLNAFLER